MQDFIRREIKIKLDSPWIICMNEIVDDGCMCVGRYVLYVGVFMQCFK